MIPNKNNLVREIGTKKTQVLHRMRLRQFTSRQSIPIIQIKQCEWKPHPEVIIKHDDLYARTWKCEHDKSVFDSIYNSMVTPSSHEITVRSEAAADEMSSSPETLRDNSPEICPQTDRSCDGTDTDHYMQPDVNTRVEQPDPLPTNHRSSKYDQSHYPKPNCNYYYRY